ncbi:hypothetical protein [Pontibaca salina]|uniref:Peptidase M48 domain-containing protein n=1 Tax=Pontibaca salina TaxID=2795731 RepID=A0A934HV31_9RHOB|nr:hypothetical protein [Pontibaca salina]MBI6630803.1 hypothetical protein [Pontibaca salina]
MTALKEYQRLEATGFWRATPEEQHREVIVSIGDATLVLSDMSDRALAHWSLAALERVNPGVRPAIYHPDGDPGETLELAETEATMIDAIERLRRAVERARPRPGRLRQIGMLALFALLATALVFWLPDALLRHTISVVPDIRRQDIGRALLTRIERNAGPACSNADTAAPLAALARRTGARKLVVLRRAPRDSLHLPGGVVLLSRALIEKQEDPAVVAGHILAERARAAQRDPLARLLANAGPLASFRLLTTGELTDATLDHHAERLLADPDIPLAEETLRDAFATAQVPSAPFARSRGNTGETMLALIKDDPMAGQYPAPVLPDRDWILLQTICGN